MGFICTIAGIGVCPVVVTFRGSDINPTPADGRVTSGMRRLFSNACALLADKSIFVSHRLYSSLFVAPRSINVIPDGVDDEMLEIIDQEVARSILKWDAEERVVLFYAGHTPRVKRLDIAKQAENILQKRDRLKIRLEVISYGLTPEEVNLKMNASDCVLLCSDYEGSPNILREAIAIGVPVVSTDVGDAREWIEKAKSGAIAQQTPSEIATAIARVVDEQRSNRVKPTFFYEMSSRATSSQVFALYQRVKQNIR